MLAQRTALTVLLAACAAGSGGCLKRTISISSTPPGALVRLNDVEVGRTPLSVDFTYYGIYDVRLQLEGYEPISTSREAKAPFFEYPGPDLVAEAVPGSHEVRIDWHFDLEPALEQSPDRAAMEAGLLERANELRSRTEPAAAPELEPVPPADAPPKPAPGS